jgi:lipoprotein NlpD
LWRICYTYDVNMQTVCRFNRIQDPERIVVGREIFIPGAERVRRVEPAPARTASDDITPEEPAARPPAGKKEEGSPGKAVRGKPPAPSPAAKARKLEFIWPLRGPVTSWFGVRKGRRHDGIDIAAKKGTPIRAAEKGKVIYSDDEIPGYGNLIIIEHAGGFHSVYAHNSRNRVDVDAFVRREQVVGEVGETGRAKGPHLHFEIRKDQRAVDPMKYLP